MKSLPLINQGGESSMKNEITLKPVEELDGKEIA
jgi:hypothetical protein